LLRNYVEKFGFSIEELPKLLSEEEKEKDSGNTRATHDISKASSGFYPAIMVFGTSPF
jgi:hypothetical protein